MVSSSPERRPLRVESGTMAMLMVALGVYQPPVTKNFRLVMFCPTISVSMGRIDNLVVLRGISVEAVDGHVVM